VELPARIEQDVGDAVVRHLGAELGARGLLLDADAFTAAAAGAAELGARLLPLAAEACFGAGAMLEFESEREAARIEAALAFGAVSARVLGPSVEAELVCGLFNLGIGMIDGLCDGDAGTGAAVLELIRARDLAGAAAVPRDRGWLRATVPPALAADPTVAFTVEVVEAFYALLHASYPEPARRRVGGQLDAALEAERRTVLRSEDAPRAELIESSRLTSVLPFEIVETLAAGGGRGTLLGEAMWLVDDLVDVCDDARCGSLNGVLLAAAPGDSRPGERERVAGLEQLLASDGLAAAAAEAADKLALALGPVDERAAFLQFVQRYAGIAAL
jgi:hypothetical protein